MKVVEGGFEGVLENVWLCGESREDKKREIQNTQTNQVDIYSICDDMNEICDKWEKHGGIEKFTGIESVSGYNLFELYIITNPAGTTPYTITS